LHGVGSCWYILAGSFCPFKVTFCFDKICARTGTANDEVFA
jgi:hypothetical protein